MDATAEFPIRSEWMYAARVTCQEFHNQTLHADRSDFEHAIDWLRRTAPEAGSIQEADALKALLKDCVLGAGIVFHQAYHARVLHKRCLASPVEASFHVWTAHDADPRAILTPWSRAFLSAFDDAHPLSLAERAAAILRERFTNPPDLDELASLLGSSRRALTRSFRRDLEMAHGDYLTRVRLGWFVEEVRKPGANMAHAAEEAGYQSYHNLVDAFRRLTALTPTEIQRLNHNERRELLDKRLALSKARRLST